MSEQTLLIYGANGYTGELVAEEAVRRGLRPLLAGRNAEEIEALAARLELDSRIFGLDDPAALARGLEGVAAVLHCAGPFIWTSKPMIAACLAAQAHYLDITGEIGVFESVQRRADQARDAGVALIPGVGFDVVPTDCLAARLAAALPNATHLTLAFTSEGGSTSPGTMKTTSLPLMAIRCARSDTEMLSGISTSWITGAVGRSNPCFESPLTETGRRRVGLFFLRRPLLSPATCSSLRP